MEIRLEPLTPDRAGDVRALLDDALLAREYDHLLAPGQIEHQFTDAFAAPEATFLATAGGVPAAFCFAFLLPQADGGAHAVLRLGVAEPFRRRGLASRLLERAAAALAPRAGVRIHVAAWQPSPEFDAFVAARGFTPARWFWRMSRAAAPAPAVSWPGGVEARLLDGGDVLLEAWTDAYNDSFAGHWGFVPVTLERVRRMTAEPQFRWSDVRVAFRDGRPCGFCRTEALGETGLVAILGTTHDARGIGLGRALLRAAVADLGARGFSRIALMVDGENETALRLYRSEGFEVDRTRRIWAAPL